MKDEISIYNLFVEFLRENNAKENYEKYVKLDFEEIKNYRYDLFCHFFNWKETEEGWKYWSNLSRKWNKFLKEKEDEETGF